MLSVLALLPNPLRAGPEIDPLRRIAIQDGGRTKPFEKVAADLYVKAMVLEDRAGQRGVIVTSDLLGFPRSVAEPICDLIHKKTGLKREQILLNSSHIHTRASLGAGVFLPADRSANTRFLVSSRNASCCT